MFASSSRQNSLRGRDSHHRGGFTVNSGRGKEIDGSIERGEDGSSRGRGRGRGHSQGRGGFRKCTHCGGGNHSVDTCYNLHGKPWKNLNQGTYSSKLTSENSHKVQDSGHRGGFNGNCGRGRGVDGSIERGKDGSDSNRGHSLGRGRGRGRGSVRHCTHCGGGNHTIDTCYDLHGKPSEVPKWIQIQKFLRKKLVMKDDFTWKLPRTRSMSITDEEGEVLKYVGGVDLSFYKEDSSIACAALIVLDLQTLEVVYQDFSHTRLTIPYIAGFLAFREAPVILKLLEKMKNSNNPCYPQLLMVDGNGILHPRRFGLACHLGVEANLPTIGIGKKLHFVDGLTDDRVRQLLQAKENCGENFVTLRGRSGSMLGAAMISNKGSFNPIYISIGHRISLDTAIKIVKMTRKYREPEPVRQADRRSREYIEMHRMGVIAR